MVQRTSGFEQLRKPLGSRCCATSARRNQRGVSIVPIVEGIALILIDGRSSRHGHDGTSSEAWIADWRAGNGNTSLHEADREEPDLIDC